jgi:hypothetical protein
LTDNSNEEPAPTSDELARPGGLRGGARDEHDSNGMSLLLCISPVNMSHITIGNDDDDQQQQNKTTTTTTTTKKKDWKATREAATRASTAITSIVATDEAVRIADSSESTENDNKRKSTTSDVFSFDGSDDDVHYLV